MHINDSSPVDFDPFSHGFILKKIPSTESQLEIWTSVQLDDEANCAFNESLALRLRGDLDYDALQYSIKQLLIRHDALRTTFSQDGMNQYVSSEPLYDFEYYDLSEFRPEEKKDHLAKLEIEVSTTPFDLVTGPLFRIKLIRHDQDLHILILTSHHIVCDGWSTWVILEELAALYKGYSENTYLDLAPPYQFSSYALEHLQRKQDPEWIKCEEFWKNTFTPLPEPLDLPTTFPRPAHRSFQAYRLDYVISEQIISRIKSFAASNKTTLNVTILAGFAAFLYRLSGQRDQVIGVPAAGQSATGHHYMIGHCVNLLPIRSRIEEADTFKMLLQRYKHAMLDAFEHQQYTYGSILKQLDIPRDTARPPLVSILFNIDQGLGDTNFGSLEMEYYTPKRFFENFEIFLNASEKNGALYIECQYNTDLFDEQTIILRLKEFAYFLNALITSPHQDIDHVPLIPDEEQQLLSTWNETLTPFPNLCIHQLFEKHVTLTPDKTAVVFDGNTLTYEALNKKADKIAIYLKSQGIGPDKFVGICLNRSHKILIAILAVLKTGAAFVPLDPEYPEARLKYIVENTGLAALLTEERIKRSEILHVNPTIYLDNIEKTIPETCPAPHFSDISPENLAYVIYTSGSTGKPKGVMVPHRALTNFLLSMQQKPGMTENDRLLAVTTLSFDISVLELFLPIITGATCVIADQETARDATALSRIIASANITVMQATPSTWRMLLASGWQGKKDLKILCGGEPMPSDIIRPLTEKCAELWNMYGPTETTVWSTCTRITNIADPVTIGKPIANTKVYILDKELQQVPIGVPGELYIAGSGVSNGYLNREKLSKKQFISNPLSQDNDVIYKTGDIARFRLDGNIEYLGRLDHQVKIRGFRIELGEIETALNAIPGISKAVVVPISKDSEDQRLAAFFIPETSPPEEQEIRTYLTEILPNYMVPQHFVKLSEFPMTPAGKIDRKKLATLEITGERTDVLAEPATDTETRLTEIWKEVLKLGQISIHDNFFNIGGHSLLAIQVVAKCKKRWDLDIPLRYFFQNPTISLFAAFIDNLLQTQKRTKGVAITPRTSHSPAPLSFQQQRLWYLSKFNPGSTVFNIPAGWRITGLLDKTLFEECIRKIFERHEILRTSIKEFDNTPKQVLSDFANFSLNFVDLSTETVNPEKKLNSLISAEAKTVFDLSCAPLFKATLYRLSEREHVFSYMPHHIIWDGWSFDIFRSELQTLYEASLAGVPAALPDLKVQYADFAEWQRERVNTPEFQEHLDYWVEKLSSDLPVLQLPTDHPRPPILTYDNGGSVDFEISWHVTEKLTNIARDSDATLFMLLLACFKILLYNYTHDRDIIIGTPISGRDNDETANLIGFFVNTLTIRSQLNPDESFPEYLKQIRKICIDAYSHQQTPFELLVETLNPVRDLSRSPIFQVLFIYQDARNRKDTLADLKLEYINAPTPGTQTDIDCWLRLTNSGISGGFRYNRDLFEHETIQRMVGHFRNILDNIIEKPYSLIRDISIVQEEEYRTLVHEWNNTFRSFPTDANVHTLIERQVRKTPDATAAVFMDKSLSYKELDDIANRWAGYLRYLGASNGTLIGICMERSLNMLACLIGILKSGAAYIPLDPEYPKERLKYMVEDSGVDIILTENNLLDRIPAHINNIIQIDKIDIHALPPGPDNVNEILPESLAYIIYTSGSTGKPKGVMVPHRALTNFLLSMQQEPGITKNDRLLAVTTLSFDIAGLELFLPLISGATCIIADSKTTADGHKLSNLISESHATIMQATPSTWRLLLSSGWRGKKDLKVLCGGEALPLDILPELLERCSELWNMYGPTETTIWSTCTQITDPSSPVSIGRPIANTQIYILNSYMRPVPAGITGELFIGGAGVTKGYLNRPQLTAERFKPNPFIEEEPEGYPPLLYRTGDLARFKKDGTIEYIERLDTQIKLRGFRIELGEIETALMSHNNVNRAVAVCREYRPGDKRLCAYIVPEVAGSLNPAELRAHLRRYLPEYMIPQHFFEIDSIPLTPAGKVDRSSLPALEKYQKTNTDFTGPQTDTEKKLASIWSYVINIMNPDIYDNFFDIGGHSLLAVELFAKIKESFGIELPLAELFKFPTIHELARRIDAELYIQRNHSDHQESQVEREVYEF